MKVTRTVNLVDFRFLVYDKNDKELKNVDRTLIDGANVEYVLENEGLKLLDVEVCGRYAAKCIIYLDEYCNLIGKKIVPITPGEPEETESEE